MILFKLALEADPNKASHFRLKKDSDFHIFVFFFALLERELRGGALKEKTGV